MTKLRHILLLVCDVDGTLTDGGLYYSVQGEELKRFHVHDGLGLELVQRANIRVAWVTHEDSAITRARARKLGITLCLTGVRDKAAAVAGLAQQLSVPPERIAYIGDDVTDIPAMCFVGMSACPADAAIEVQQVADYVCRRPGGGGAVRELCELLLHARGMRLESLLSAVQQSSQ